MDPLGGPRTCGIWPPAPPHVRRGGPPAGRPGVTWGHVAPPPRGDPPAGPPQLPGVMCWCNTSLSVSLRKGAGLLPSSASGDLPPPAEATAARDPALLGGRGLQEATGDLLWRGAQMDPLMADPPPSEPAAECRAGRQRRARVRRGGGCLGPWAVHAWEPCPVLACPCSSHTPQNVGALSATSQDSSFRRWLDTSRSGHTTLVLAHSRLEDMIIHVSSLSMTQVMIMHCSTRHAQCHCRMRLSNVHCVVVKDSSAAPTMQAN